MKKCTSILAVFLVFLTLISCERKVSETITFQSTDDRLKLVVSGERYTSLDPWMMTIQQVLSDSTVNSATVEAHFDLPSTENVLVEWKTPTDAMITFVEKDGTLNQIPVKISF